MAHPRPGNGGAGAMTVLRILFVCMGNICRSPAAQGVFEARVREAGLQRAIEVDSAGTGAYHVGEAPDPRAQAAAFGRGVDISALRARAVAPEDFRRFDYLLAMDRRNLAALQRLCPPRTQVRLDLFMRYAPGGYGREIADPYAGGPDGFEEVLDQIEVASRGLLQALCASYGLRPGGTPHR